MYLRTIKPKECSYLSKFSALREEKNALSWDNVGELADFGGLL
jgi:hypothetical protein